MKTSGPTSTVLPSGFQVQIDPRCARRGNLRYLVGGSPMRVMKLSDPALGMTSVDGRIAVADVGTQVLARRLLDAGIAHPRPMSGPCVADVTLVIPVRGNQSGVDRLLTALSDQEASVVVVDDGSDVPIEVGGRARLIRFDENRGPAAARNAGAAAASTEFVAFLDSDTVPTGDWLTMLLGHFADPTVAIVAPRIVGLQTVAAGGDSTSSVADYANRFSSLDMGPREALVAPGTPLAYVPSAAMVVRRTGFLSFDESLRVAEDVDLCWRTHQAGWRIRYDPIAEVAHDHRESLSGMLDRRRFYGTGAAELALRHGRLAAPVVMTAPVAAGVVALATRTRVGMLVAAVIAAIVCRNTMRAVAHVPHREK
ncbi:MAG: mycofactocin biosynthesis glycosyltransferase MftF, partial [Gordonia sp. (in: high G+C Gram-positive bacteria)]|nr:mycofactocin biosynthesis glycosyltransferase MftF [Gordonia sp. (in: high G+C Gram-positive bacteria)]